MNQAAQSKLGRCIVEMIGQSITMLAAGVAELERIGSQIPLEKDNIIC
jgi:hypothetical protein